MRQTVYIALGSNIGNKAEILRKALDMLRRREGITLKRVSGLIETAPVGGPGDQPDYLNGVAELETSLCPEALLAALQEIEAALGRNRQAELRWGPRTCDLDILLMDYVIMDTPELTIPHPRLTEREFVLGPLCEIAPNARHPVTHKTAADMLAELRSRL
ncbi:MAG: 2-amino-4-hydroxy-6-hydroxymethyldihydropteridine diphosphokinase [Phycisphaerae bacterium]|nr:2-amino-4-hydroxy-6-hydroxymethyldihydropteridine diphosphokinase [Phycisphaerae bacterium]